MNASTKFKTVDEYFSTLAPKQKKLLTELRTTIRKAAPKAEEVISYNMPAIRQGGVLVYYAAYEKHIGFYPTASPIIAFKKELAGYEVSRGTVRFPIDEPIPNALVTKIVKFRVKEVSEKTKKRS
ncbi:MAG TPA: DUF1801 domain-containing protein [Candidatus Kapabacteria bacterium]|nr:DUF1801 domain-containing protein [Candidatus Kapabacteria bacterium]HYM36533.1 DUF1801 domain-containing protein [Steroidobacteraceae bacterium]